MLARRITKPNGWPKELGHREAPHRVEVQGDEFVARCGVRFSRKADCEVLPDHYTGEVCKPCG
jgi:hypothetical protein